MIFIPDRDGDDRPDGAPIVLLDGFKTSTDNHHTFANGLKWGPDGWLYGRCGASSAGRIGVPGTADEQRVPLNGGVWRYRPSDWNQATNPTAVAAANEGIFEVLSHGTTNPWGMDWNEFGEAFFINTVNGHLWHVIPGAHFRRPHSEDPNPYVYSTIDAHADHYHWDTGKDWTDSRKVSGEHDRLGGGHAHCGATIYLGDNWPESYRGRLMTLNLHGRRVNVDRLERDGCGYVGRHEPDILQAADKWFRGIDLSYGPDGAVYLLDWSDTGECHEATGVHRTSGRIFRVSYKSDEQQAPRRGLPLTFDLGQLDDSALVLLHRDPNEWFVRQARQVLADRFAADNDPNRTARQKQTCSQLVSLLEADGDVVIKLRALHSLYVLQCASEHFLLKQLEHPNGYVRAWAVRLLTDDWPLDTIMGQPHPRAFAERGSQDRSKVVRELVRVAVVDQFGLVRLALASTLQRLPVDQRIQLATPLASRESDSADHNLPLMVWYGLMPVAGADPSRSSQPDQLGPVALARFACDCRFPTTRRLISRRLAEMIDDQPAAVEQLLSGATTLPILAEILAGLSDGFAGRHKVSPPSNWDAVQKQVAGSTDPELIELTRDLSVLFGDGRALEEVEKIALDSKADLAARRMALKTLIDSKAPHRRKICEQLLSTRYLNMTAITGLTEFDDRSIGDKLSKNYRSFFPADRPAVIDALVSRRSFATALLDEIAAGKIPKADLTVLNVRQIRSFNEPKLTEQLTEVWGELRDSPQDKQTLIAKLKTELTPKYLAVADKPEGRALFARVCGNCHRLYGHGGQIGPDLTGSGRQNLDYVLLNLVDPSAAVGADYRMSVIVLNDGRIFNGIVVSKTDRALTVQTAKERLTIERSDIEEEQASSLSLMPDGQLQLMTQTQIRDLVAYLMNPTQVPLREN